MQIMTVVEERARMRCPYCGTTGVAERSCAVTEVVREITYRCQNRACKCRWVAHLQAVRVLNPPVYANHPNILPMSTKQQTRESRKERS